MEQGWDPEVTRYFKKIINTIAFGLLWMMSVLTAGFYFGLAYHPVILYTILFYAGFIISLLLLIRYYLHLWKK